MKTLESWKDEFDQRCSQAITGDKHYRVDWSRMPAKFVKVPSYGQGITYKSLGGLKQKPKRANKPVKI